MPSFPNPRAVISVHLRLFCWLLWIGMAAPVLRPWPVLAADPPSTPEQERQFTEVVHPFLQRYCTDCHGTKKQEGKLDLSGESSLTAVVKNFRTWENVVDRLVLGEMPPKESERQPTTDERDQVIAWTKAVRKAEATRNAGDPGIVLARRLSNAEYDNTIRDLIGVDLRPTREFPVDPANESGFDNSGESLTMSPALVTKYLAATRFVADHLVLTPQGFEFAPHPVVTETDRDKYCVQEIVSFYQRHEVDFADYFFAAWRFQHRTAAGMPEGVIGDFAWSLRGSPDHSDLRSQRRFTLPGATTESPRPQSTAGIDAAGKRALSTRYLATIWSALTEDAAMGPLADLQAQWKKLPADPLQTDAALRECRRLRDLVITWRKELDTPVKKLHVKGNSDGSQPLVLWWNRQIASRRMSYSGDGTNPKLDVARNHFCQVFPNAFSISSRGHYADPNLGAQVRLLTAGFHLMQGYFRDDTPLYQLVLDEPAQAELDGLWQNLNFVTLVPLRQYKDFLFFERAEPPQFAGGPEFDFARPENKDVTSEAKLQRMRDAYLLKARANQASEEAIDAIETYFHDISRDVRWIEQSQQAAEQRHLDSLGQFAEQAYRRPLTVTEQAELVRFYASLRMDDGLNHEEAMRDSVVSILMSPYFSYRYELASPGQTTTPLTDEELASRLSYFLWSSMPDQELLLHAQQQQLHQPEVLRGQARRMLQDPRVQGFATEFAGQWLEFRRFEEHNSVDRERFSTFTNELRQAMYEEPLRLFVEIARKNRSVLDFLHARDTFVNPILARHYGIPLEGLTAELKTNRDGWVQIQNAGEFGRGGLLPMSVFLTRNSPGLRTSPVKRGYWVVRCLLGEHIPPPPPEVAELPKDEASLGNLTLPQLLARHRNHQACAGCHQRFDAVGLVFEGFGPIGERRDQDLGGRPVEIQAVFPDGTEGIGVEGLRTYLTSTRRDEFVMNLSRKMLAYGLGRSLLLSDQQLLDQLQTKLAADEYRFENLIETIITSRQFLHKRGLDDPRN